MWASPGPKTTYYSALFSFCSNFNHPCWHRIILKTFVHPWLTLWMAGFLGKRPICLDLNVQSYTILKQMKKWLNFCFYKPGYFFNIFISLAFSFYSSMNTLWTLWTHKLDSPSGTSVTGAIQLHVHLFYFTEDKKKKKELVPHFENWHNVRCMEHREHFFKYY